MGEEPTRNDTRRCDAGTPASYTAAPGRSHAPVLRIVVPCFNEEAALPLTVPQLLDELDLLVRAGAVARESGLLLVDDGSDDGTWDVICSIAAADERVAGVALAHNRGFQAALMAGLMEARDACDICISIDADGQDDVRAMGEMVRAWSEGAEVVYGVRSDRASDSWPKRMSAQLFYRTMRALGAETVYNHADYRLLSAPVLDELARYREVNLYLRGLIPQLGFPGACVGYSRRPRVAGKSHYSVPKMVALALDGITSVSTRPVHLVALAGLAIAGLAVVGALWAVIELALGRTVPGWTSLVCIVCLIGGLQLLALGFIGEYVGRIYLETKRRPRYLIARRTGGPEGSGQDAAQEDPARR